MQIENIVPLTHQRIRMRIRIPIYLKRNALLIWNMQKLFYGNISWYIFFHFLEKIIYYFDATPLINININGIKMNLWYERQRVCENRRGRRKGERDREEREITKKPQTDMLLFYPNYIHISCKACRCILPLKHDDFEFNPNKILFQCVFFS